jgi:hypothetical protein
MNRTRIKIWVMSSLFTAGALLAPGAASAVSLYWGETPVHTNSTRTCLSYATTAMRAANVQHIRQSSNEVAGTLGGTYAAITCVGTSPRATAIVMVAGDDGGATARLRDTLRGKIAGVVSFD